MTLVSRTFSKDVNILLSDSSNVYDLISKSPNIGLKCLQQLVQNAPFCKHHKEVVKKIFIQVTQLVLTGIIPWSEVSRAMDIMIRFNRTPFRLDVINDYILKASSGTISSYSRLLILHHCPALRKESEDNPAKLVSSYRNIAPIVIVSMDFDELYRSFICPDFAKANLWFLDMLKRMILQCKNWGYKQGYEGYQGIFNDRLENIVEVLAETYYVKSSGFEIVERHCREFLTNHQFFYEEAGGKSVYKTFNILPDDPLLRVFMPSILERRKLVNSLFNYDGLNFFSESKVEVIELIVCKGFVEVNYVLLEGAEIRNLFKHLSTLQRSQFPVLNTFQSLVLRGINPAPLNIIMGFCQLLSFVGIDFVRNPLVTVSLLEKVSLAKNDLKQLRLIQCPLVRDIELIKIPEFFPQLELFALNGGELSINIFKKYLSLPLLSLMLSSCRVEWPDDLTGLFQLHTLELTFIENSMFDLVRIFDAIDKLTNLIMIGNKNFDLSILKRHFKSLKRLTLSGDILDKPNAFEYIAQMENLKSLHIEGAVKPKTQSLILEIRKEIKISSLGNL